MIFLLVFMSFSTSLLQAQLIPLNVNVTRVFIQEIKPNMLSWNDRELQNDFHYVVTSSEGPDLPPWLYTKYFKDESNLFIFGAAPKDVEMDRIELQISITSLQSYRNKYVKLILSINVIEELPKYEIHLRINNVNIKEMLNPSRQKVFIEIFENYFWKESKDRLYLTFLAASEDVGFRLPLNPNDTAGVVLHLGSIINFSSQLFSLQNETVPLSKHCPSFDKRITVERFFRPKNFIIDWCSFKLVQHDECFTSSNFEVFSQNCSSWSQNVSEDPLKLEEKFLISKEEIPPSPVYGIIILLIIIPSLFLGFIIASWLASFMCLNNAKLTRRLNGEISHRDEFDAPQVLFQF